MPPYNPSPRSLVGAPVARLWSVKFTLLEWLQWQQCFSARPQGLGFICSASPSCRRSEPWQADSQTGWLTDWLTGQIARGLESGIQSSECVSNSVCLHRVSEKSGIIGISSFFIFPRQKKIIFPGSPVKNLQFLGNRIGFRFPAIFCWL